MSEADRNFSGEEGLGKQLDLHKHYLNFCNIKKLRLLNLVKSEDYLTWLHNFDKLHLIPLYIKQGNKYEKFISEMTEYLMDFYQRTHPLVDFKSLIQSTEEVFESEWEQKSLFGWESVIYRINGET